MRKKVVKKEENATDMELKALVDAFVESAVNKGYTASKIYAMTQKSWQEYTSEKRDVVVLPEESDEEVAFRRKAETFVEKNPDISPYRILCIEYEESGKTKITTATIEFLCVMHKAFLSNEDVKDVKLQNVKKEVIKRLKAMKYEFPATAEVDRACRQVKRFFLNKRLDWYRGLSDFCEVYECRRGSIAEIILIMEWCINNNYCK